MLKILKMFTFVLFPVIRIGFPFPVPILHAGLVKGWSFLKSYFYPLVFSSIYLLVAIIISNHGNLTISDLAYGAFPLIYLLLIHVFYENQRPR